MSVPNLGTLEPNLKSTKWKIANDTVIYGCRAKLKTPFESSKSQLSNGASGL